MLVELRVLQLLYTTIDPNMTFYSADFLLDSVNFQLLIKLETLFTVS